MAQNLGNLKKCDECGIEKLLNEFPYHKKSNYFEHICKHCGNAKKRENYLLKTPEEKKIKSDKSVEWNKNNPEKRKVIVNNYHENHKEEESIYYENNKEYIINRNKKWYLLNKTEINKKSSKRRKNNPMLKIKHVVSVLIRHALKASNGSKACKSCFKHLPYTAEELKNYIESLFEPWMTWKNHGVYNPKTWDDNDSSTWTWQLGHIVPQSELIYTSMEEDNFKKCWALSNLKPQSAKENILDGTRLKRKYTQIKLNKL